MRWFLALLFVVISAGCAHRPAEYGALTASESVEARGVEKLSGVAVVGRPSFRSIDFSPATGALMEAPPPPQDGRGDVIVDKSATNRKIVYTADMTLRVPNKGTATTSIEELIKKYGGYIQRSSLDAITFRVKPADFEKVLADLEALGEVTARNVNSSDVTEQYTDLELRIETATSSRQRLIVLLEKTNVTKDVIEIERDIRRLTEEIETIKGKLRVLADQVDLSTITVRLEEKYPDQVTTPRRTSTPFEWMRQVGIEQTLEFIPEDAPMSRRKLLLLGPEFMLGTADGAPAPEGFVPLLMTRSRLVAATPEDSRLRAQYFKMRQQQGRKIDFWAQALEAELEQNRGYMLLSSDPFALEESDEHPAWHLATETIFSGETWLYDLWVVTDADSPRELVVIEYARPKRLETEKGAELLGNIEEAIRKLEL